MTGGILVGQYRLEEKLGEGGMGTVYRAVHTKLQKQVALKVLPAGFLAESALVSRFEREMRAIGKLEHPHIVRALDAGEFQGLHYLVLEYVDGPDLAKLVRERGPLDVAEASWMIRDAAIGLQHAHEHGLVHRDIKPSNLLVASARTATVGVHPSSEKHIKIVDLGLAQLADERGTMKELTAAGQLFGTPDYMAPEQWDDNRASDARTDLYALGCTFFCLLTGRPPFGNESHPSTGAKRRGHLEELPPSLRAIRPDVPPELDTIVRKLLSKRPQDRFQSAAELAEALCPFAKGQKPVAVALDPDAGGRGGRRANRVVLGAGGLGAAALLFGIIIMITAPDGSKTQVKVPRGSTIQISEDSEAERGKPDVSRSGKGDPASAKPQRLSGAPASKGDRPASPLQEGTLPPLSPRAFVGRPARIEGVQSWSVESREPLAREIAIATDPQGRFVATAGEEGIIRLRDPNDYRVTRLLLGHTAGITTLDWSRDGKYLASGSFGGEARIWEIPSGRLMHILNGKQTHAVGVRWSPDRSKLLVVGAYGGPHMVLWDVVSKPTSTIIDPTGSGMEVGLPSWSADGKFAVFPSRENPEALGIWSMDRNFLARDLPDARVNQLRGKLAFAWSPDGQRIAAAGRDRKIRVFDPETRKAVLTFDLPETPSVEALAWSPSGDRLAGILHQGVHIWNAENGAEIRAMPQIFWGNGQFYHSLNWSADGKRIVAMTEQEGVVWNATSGERVAGLSPRPSQLRPVVAISPDGKRMASGFGSEVVIRDAGTGTPIATWKGHQQPVDASAWSPDGTLFASAAHADRIIVRNAMSGEIQSRFDVSERLSGLRLVWCPDNHRLTLLSRQDGANGAPPITWDVTTGEQKDLGLPGIEIVQAMCWSPDGSLVVVAQGDNSVLIWDTMANKAIKSLSFSKTIHWVEFAADGRRLAIGESPGTIHIWDRNDGLLKDVTGPRPVVLTWSRDGRSLASAGGDAFEVVV
ncbi:MAG: protein kinase, partial [Planctomycetaceae bacterium]|nr:protein kinase [Planctomycetaceae bacterium]